MLLLLIRVRQLSSYVYPSKLWEVTFIEEVNLTKNEVKRIHRSVFLLTWLLIVSLMFHFANDELAYVMVRLCLSAIR